MRILFLNGSLEPGHDGVGDYIRRLALEMQRVGNQIACMALYDHYVIQEESNVNKLKYEGHLIIRLPALWPEEMRFERAQYWITKFNPEWLSLQFVPWSFNFRGLPFNLGKRLGLLGAGRSWHIMIHELWVGMNHEASVKHVVLGMMQRHIIKKLIFGIKPKIIHTQTLLYKTQLARLGFESQYLPLFSNIPNVRKDKWMPSISDNKPGNCHCKAIYLVVFGIIYPGVQLQKLACDAFQYATKNSVSVVLTMIGRCGSEQERWTTIWKQAGLPVEVLGVRTSEEISSALLKSSLGVATTPAFLISKSGTAAAMQEHGLPVICLSPPWNPRRITEDNLVLPDGIMLYEEGNLEYYLSQKFDSSLAVKVSDVASQLSTVFQNLI